MNSKLLSCVLAVAVTSVLFDGTALAKSNTDVHRGNSTTKSKGIVGGIVIKSGEKQPHFKVISVHGISKHPKPHHKVVTGQQANPSLPGKESILYNQAQSIEQSINSLEQRWGIEENNISNTRVPIHFLKQLNVITMEYSKALLSVNSLFNKVMTDNLQISKIKSNSYFNKLRIDFEVDKKTENTLIGKVSVYHKQFVSLESEIKSLSHKVKHTKVKTKAKSHKS